MTKNQKFVLNSIGAAALVAITIQMVCEAKRDKAEREFYKNAMTTPIAE